MNTVLAAVESIRLNTLKNVSRERQVELGQFLTPPAVAQFMASLFSNIPQNVILLDPGAGVGTLTTALLQQMVQSSNKPIQISAFLYEIDTYMLNGLEETLEQCRRLCKESEIECDLKVIQKDFVVASVENIKAQGSFFRYEQLEYNTVILNPPYRKINGDSTTRRLLDAVGIETTNLYTAFLWLTVKQLADNGQLVAIVPRSFCNGSYFRPFRKEFLRDMAIQRIHVFESRKEAFNEGDVLQENIILHAIKTIDKGNKVVISSSFGPASEDIKQREVNYSDVINPDDPDFFIRIISDELGQEINRKVRTLKTSLDELGLYVSTGRVVEFRAKELLQDSFDNEAVPLIYPMNMTNGFVVWPKTTNKKAVALANHPKVKELVVPSSIYVLVKRFSSKEEKKRISAAIYLPEQIHASYVGFENHLNYFHRQYGNISLPLAKGLTAYLNSTLLDEYFRQFSGHTQVNATDLRNLKYPTESQLYAIGARIGNRFPDQHTLDQIILEELSLSNATENPETMDPIQAKRKVREALSILQVFQLPRAQQNDRSALTLLALLNMRPSTPWQEASNPLLGITEMMDYFRENYGINYAPNTRETVRRETIHQFLQMGIIVANPDNPSRPINSPKTRYQIESSALSLIRNFGSEIWDIQLKEYLGNAPLLASLRMKEREMSLMPVTLPDGASLLLSPGGQNELLKKIIEEFCPRFTPGGKVVYVGDAGDKLNEQEVDYFEHLGINVNPHGKMPDVIVYMQDKNWLVLIEAVTSHGPINIKRHNELKQLFTESAIGLVFVTAFETRRAMNKYLSEISWETEVWVAESPSHLIHFDGEKFLGPYNA